MAASLIYIACIAIVFQCFANVGFAVRHLIVHCHAICLSHVFEFSNILENILDSHDGH
jgi:hypothetical protein